MLDNGAELSVKALFHDLRQRISVDLTGTLVGDLHQLLLGSLDSRREGALGDRADVLDHVGNGVGVGDDHFLCLFLAQILEFRQHLLSSPQVEHGLVLSVTEAHGGQDYLAENCVLGVDEVNIAGCADRDPQLVAQLDDPTVVVLELLDALSSSLTDHELVVAYRLDLKIVVELGQPLDLLLGLFVDHSLEELSGLAGAAEDQALTVLLKN